MTELTQNVDNMPSIQLVNSGQDMFHEHRGLGVSRIDFKVIIPDNSLFIIENTFHKKGGPARHLHFDQDEYFYCVEGTFIIEIGSERMTLEAGDSVFAPRNVPHVWAHIGESRGKMLITFTPAGKMEAFFREVTKADAMPPQDPQLWTEHGMQLLGAPLSLA